MKVCGESGKSLGTIFPTAFAHFMSLCHILVILAVFQTFSLLFYLLWWSVISDLWRYYCKKMTTCWSLRWWLAYFSNNVFSFIELAIFFLICVMLYLFIYLFIYLWLCWVLVSVRGLSLVVASGSHSSSRCAGLSLSRPLLLRSTGSRRAGSATAAHGPSRSAACGILPDQDSNPYPLHWQADSQPLRHQGSPNKVFFNVYTLCF